MNKKLLRSVREYKRQSFLTPALVTLEVLMEVLIPLLMANIIDVGIAQGDMGYIVKMGVLLVSIRYRIFLSEISTIFQHQAL